MTPSPLLPLMQALASGALKIIDLTQTLSPQTPVLQLPAQFGQCAPFQLDEVARYDERGPAWYWNNFSCNEHTGTHFDAPVHWVTGKDLPDNATDTVPVADFLAHACVLDCSAESAADNDFLLTIAFVEQWERLHGRIPPRSWLLMRTDWSKRAMPEGYLNLREDGMHTPGPDAEVVQWLIRERQVLGFGVEAIGTDAGQAHGFSPAYPCHYHMHGNSKYGLQCLTNLDLLPAQGALVFAAPLKIKGGSGSPLRVIALVAS